MLRISHQKNEEISLYKIHELLLLLQISFEMEPHVYLIKANTSTCQSMTPHEPKYQREYNKELNIDANASKTKCTRPSNNKTIIYSHFLLEEQLLQLMKSHPTLYKGHLRRPDTCHQDCKSKMTPITKTSSRKWSLDKQTTYTYHII